MGSFKRSFGLAAAVFIVGAMPSRAASPITRAFLAHVSPNVDFLDRSSRFALDNSKNTRVRAFAHDEAREQTLAANALYDWTQANGDPMIASAGPELDPTPTGSTGAASQPATTDQAPTDRILLGQEDLDSLEGQNGLAFDTEYKTKQRDALRQIEADYTDYLAIGDDPTLLKIAKAELPKIKARRRALDKL